jgi:acyl-coenzyme A synthetase/AMP-(fatty) acid ligase
VPLTLSDPAERRALVLADAAPALVLGEGGVDPGQVAAAPDGWLPPVPDADGPAVIHYTSGSSGRPKGIVVSHFGVLYRAARNLPELGLRPADVVLATSAPALGSGLSFVLGTLFAGATMAVVSLAGEGAGAVLRLAARERASVMIAGPAIMRSLLALPGAAAMLGGLRHLRMGATGLPVADLRAFRALLPAGCAISHTYASTEAMVIARWLVPPGEEGAGPNLAAGYPAPGLAWRLRQEGGAQGDDAQGDDAQGDDALGDDALGDSVEGELEVAARHLALGEWQDGRIVPGRMRADPADPRRRIFATGDLMRLDAAGRLHFVARADRQVKVNGVRVEPAEIEAVLRAEPGVREAVVLEIGGALVGFVAAPEEAAAAVEAALVVRLRASLPPALRPRRLVVLAAMPMLALGKPDLVALRAM